MNRAIITEENKWLLEAIVEQYEAITRHGEHIPRIESDILMENVRKFYENLHRLQRLSEPATPPPASPPPPPQATPSPAPAREAESPASPAGSVLTPAPGITVTISDPEPVSPAGTAEEDEEPAPPAAIPFKPAGPPAGRQENMKATQRGAGTAAMDLFADEEPTFSIRLKEAREKSLGPKVPSARIENLKTAITINEKFMFINELFDGNLREYNETIETLNGLNSLDQAAGFLDLMRKKNFWNTGSNAFRKLTELVERRF